MPAPIPNRALGTEALGSVGAAEQAAAIVAIATSTVRWICFIESTPADGEYIASAGMRHATYLIPAPHSPLIMRLRAAYEFAGALQASVSRPAPSDHFTGGVFCLLLLRSDFDGYSPPSVFTR